MRHLFFSVLPYIVPFHDPLGQDATDDQHEAVAKAHTERQAARLVEMERDLLAHLLYDIEPRVLYPSFRERLLSGAWTLTNDCAPGEPLRQDVCIDAELRDLRAFVRALTFLVCFTSYGQDPPQFLAEEMLERLYDAPVKVNDYREAGFGYKLTDTGPGSRVDLAFRLGLRRLPGLAYTPGQGRGRGSGQPVWIQLTSLKPPTYEVVERDPEAPMDFGPLL